jgi:hypothetical protein
MMTTGKVFNVAQNNDPFYVGNPPVDKFKLLSEALADLENKKITQEQFDEIKKSLQ